MTILTELAEVQKRIEQLPHERAKLIVEARAHHTWREIGDALGMTEHGAIKAAQPSDLKRGRPRA